MATDLGRYGSGDARAYEPPPVRTRVRLTRRHLTAVPLVLLAVEAAVLGARLHAQGARDADPAKVASAFLAAVAGDRAAEAAGLTRLPAGVETRFTQADLQAQGGIVRPTVTGSTRHGDRATVSVAYTLAGLGAHSDLVLARSYAGLLRAPTWRIVGGLPVIHVAAARFEERAEVDGRPVVLRNGVADVTVLPGLVPVRLPAQPPARNEAMTVAATTGRTVARFQAVVADDVGGRLEDAIERAVQARAAAYFPGGPEEFSFLLGDDGTTITFHGQLTGGTVVDPTGTPIGAPPIEVFSGTATYAGGRVTITELHVQ